MASADLMSRQFFGWFAGSAIGGFLGGFLGNQVLFWRMRPFLRQALQECDDAPQDPVQSR